MSLKKLLLFNEIQLVRNIITWANVIEIASMCG